MDIQGMGESIVDLLVENKFVANIADIYTLNTPSIQVHLLKFPGLGDKKIAEIIKGIEESKHKAFRRLLNGLGISHVGKKIAQDITQALIVILSKAKDITNNRYTLPPRSRGQSDIIEYLTNVDFLASIYGIGEKTVQTITHFFQEKNNIKMLEALKATGVNLDPHKYNDQISASEAKGSFSITWSFAIPREKIAEMMQQHWYLFHESPTKTTNVMLIGEKPGNKKAKAQEYGVRIVEWREKIISEFPFLQEGDEKIKNEPKSQSLF